jgi:hypothetical protein
MDQKRSAEILPYAGLGVRGLDVTVLKSGTIFLILGMRERAEGAWTPLFRWFGAEQLRGLPDALVPHCHTGRSGSGLVPCDSVRIGGIGHLVARFIRNR